MEKVKEAEMLVKRVLVALTMMKADPNLNPEQIITTVDMVVEGLEGIGSLVDTMERSLKDLEEMGLVDDFSTALFVSMVRSGDLDAVVMLLVEVAEKHPGISNLMLLLNEMPSEPLMSAPHQDN